MVEMVHDRIAAGETTVVSTFPGQSLSKNKEIQFGRGYGPVARQNNT
jgi:hypothetical protein